jgi:hypothetical protein
VIDAPLSLSFCRRELRSRFFMIPKLEAPNGSRGAEKTPVTDTARIPDKYFQVACGFAISYISI